MLDFIAMQMSKVNREKGFSWKQWSYSLCMQHSNEKNWIGHVDISSAVEWKKSFIVSIISWRIQNLQTRK